MKALLSHQIVTPTTSLLDYGCGLGDDVRNLRELGFNAAGWDPVYFPDDPVVESDVVNFGYVLNVIEDPQEREQALKRAYSVTRRILCVAVLVGAADYEGRAVPFGDGVLTRRSTFQKYFQHDEIVALLDRALGAVAISIAPGIYFVFRHAEDQSDFLLKRLHTVAIPSARSVAARHSRGHQNAVVKEFIRRENVTWERYLDFVREMGRPPLSVESTALAVARGYGVRETELFDQAQEDIGRDVVQQIETTRRRELLVFLAISHFRQIPRLKDLPPPVAQSVRYLFGSFENAVATSRERLMEVGNQENLRRVVEEQEFGLNTPDGYFLRSDTVGLLPETAQILARLSELFGGDLASTHVVKIHKRSPKVTLFTFDDFDTAPEPVLRTRVKVDLKEQTVRVFDHSNESNPEVLVGKEIAFDRRKLLLENPADSTVLGLLQMALPFGTIARRSVVARIRDGG